MGKNSSLKRVDKLVAECGGDQARLEKELKKLIRTERRSGDIVLLGAAYCELAAVLYRQGARDAALSCALKAEALLKDTDAHKKLVLCYNLLGISYFSEESFQVAIEHYSKAYSISKRWRLSGRDMIYTLNNIATCYYMMGDFKTGIKYLSESIKMLETRLPDDYSCKTAFNVNLADCYERIGEPEKAMAILDGLDGFLDKVKLPGLACDCRIRRACLSFTLGKPEEGNRQIDAAFDEIGTFGDVYAVYEDVARAVHVLLTNGERERASRAAELLNAYSERNPGTMDQLVVCRAMAEYHKSTGEHELAMEYYEKLDELYEKRMSELKEMQLNAHNRMKIAE
ncbi:MAG: hypothetical protein J5449_02745, partial [Oscillospiraceae bacterium]|nr:hypothetical protein [Oscillospiraceae bacterium]